MGRLRCSSRVAVEAHQSLVWEIFTYLGRYTVMDVYRVVKLVCILQYGSDVWHVA